MSLFVDPLQALKKAKGHRLNQSGEATSRVTSVNTLLVISENYFIRDHCNRGNLFSQE